MKCKTTCEVGDKQMHEFDMCRTSMYRSLVKNSLNLTMTALLVVFVGCDSNLVITASVADVDCSVIPNHSQCANAGLDEFRIDSAEVDQDRDLLKVMWNDASVFASATVALAMQKDCSAKAATFNTLSGDPINLSSVADGVYYVCLSSEKDQRFFQAINNGDFKIIVDRHPPEIGAIADIVTNTDVFLNASVKDATSVTKKWTMVSGPASAHIQESNGMMSASFNVEGVYVLHFTATDAVGKVSTRDVQVTFDTTPPTVDAGADVNANALFNKAATVGVDAKTVTWSKISGPGDIVFADEHSATSSMAASIDGTYVIRLTATDLAGNSASDDFTLVWNTVGPIFVSLANTNAASDGFINDSEKILVSDLFVLNAASYATAMYAGPLAVSVTCDISQNYNKTNMPQASDLIVDGDWVFCVKLEDGFSNITYGKSQVVTRDIVAPTFTSLVAANAASDGYVNAAEVATPAAIVTLSATGHAAAHYTAVLADSVLTCDNAQNYSEISIPAINTIPAMDGAYALCVELTDAAGNITYGKSQQIVRDTNAPSVNVGSDIITNITASINATAGGSPVTYAWTKQSGSGSVTFGTPFAENTTAYANAEETYGLRLTVTDAAGNSAYDELNFTWDTTAPSFTSLALANGASDLVVNQADVTANQAIVSGVVGSGYDDVIYQVFSAATTCSSETYTASANTIPTTGSISALADGSYKVCVKLTDKAGNSPAYGASASFTLDKTAPAAGNAGFIATQGTNNVKTSLSWTAASDSVTLGANLHYSVYYSTTASFSSVAEVEAGTLLTSGTNITSYAVSGLTAATTYYFNIVVRDAAGNKAAYVVTKEKTRDAAFTDLAVGDFFACGLTEGNAYCWGDNTYGQLGDGTTTASNIPVAVNSSLRFTSISAGQSHACAIADGIVYCWGNGANGRLGTGNTSNQSTPMAIDSTDKFRAVSVGYDFSCAIRVDGVVLCWGIGGAWLGKNTLADALSPATVSGSLTFRKINNMYHHTCGVTTDGDAYCWGIGGEGQIGHGVIGVGGNASVPTRVLGEHKFRDIAAGYTHSCGIRTDGLAYCWGDDTSGALGNGSGQAHSSTPMAVANAHRYRSIQIGQEGSCAIDDSGDLYCWGKSYFSGGLDQGAPVLMGSGKKFRSVYADMTSACAIATNGISYCWGAGSNGKLGIGSTSTSYSLAAVRMDNVTGDASWLKMAGGGASGCGLKSNGKIYCWGSNSDGQLGDNTTTSQPSPLNSVVATVDTFIDLSVGESFACGINAEGYIACWGSASSGVLGNGQSTTNALVPVPLTSAGRYMQISSGLNHNCAVDSQGQLVCWGNDSHGKLGNGSDSSSDVTEPMVSDNTVKYLAVASGANHSCALIADGTIKCWGHGDGGRLGTGNAVSQDFPVSVSGAETYFSVSTGDSHSCALQSNGLVACWGDDTYGQLGDDVSLVDQSTPTLVDSENTYLSAVALGSNSCGIRVDGALYCWGFNDQGAVGDGTSGTNRSTPVVVSLSKTFKPGSLGGKYALYGITTDGWAYGWGDDASNATGNGRATENVLTPQPILRAVTRVSATASSTSSTFVAGRVIDGNYGTGWAAQSYVAWNEVKLDRTYNIKRVRMVYINGTGNYTHTLKAGPTANPSSQFWSITQTHAGNVWFEPVISPGQDDARFVRLNSSNGTNWIGWGEIEFFE